MSRVELVFGHISGITIKVESESYIEDAMEMLEKLGYQLLYAVNDEASATSR